MRDDPHLLETTFKLVVILLVRVGAGLQSTFGILELPCESVAVAAVSEELTKAEGPTHSEAWRRRSWNCSLASDLPMGLSPKRPSGRKRPPLLDPSPKKRRLPPLIELRELLEAVEL